MIKKLILLCCLIFPCFCYGVQGVTKQQEASFEVAGLRIGMTEAEAIQALTNKFNIPEDQIQRNMYGIDLYLKTDKDGIIKVQFIEDITQTPHRKVIYDVLYELPDTTHDIAVANIKALYNRTFEQYGNYTQESGPFFTWCVDTQQLTCADDSTHLTVFKNFPIISIRNEKYIDALKKREQSNK